MLEDANNGGAARRLARAPLTWAFAAGLVVYGLAIALDLPPPAGRKYVPAPGAVLIAPHIVDKAQALRGWSIYPEGWYWPLIDPAPIGNWLLVIGLGVLGALGLRLLERPAARHARIAVLALAGLVLLGYALELGTLALKAPNPNQLMLDRVLDRSFTGYFTSAAQIADTRVFFVNYAKVLTARDDATGLCGHCRTHPPGPILFYWIPIQTVAGLPDAWQQGLSAGLVNALGVNAPNLSPPQTVVALLSGHVILLGAALIVVPLYGLARLLAGPAPALRLAALGLVVPGILLMSPELDQLYATLAAVLFYLALRGLTATRRVAEWGFGAGLVLAVGLYGSFGLWVLGIPLAALAVAAALGVLDVRSGADGIASPPLRWTRALLWLVTLGAGTALPWGLLWTLGQFDLPLVLQIASNIQWGGITLRRPYQAWLLFDLTDFLQFVGLPLVAVTLLTLVWWRRRQATPAGYLTVAAGAAWPLRLSAWITTHLNLYALLFWGVVVALDVSGTVRAEVGRIWLFLMPLALLAIYHAAGRGRLSGPQIAGLLAAQFVVCVLIGGRWLTPFGCCPQ